MFSKHLKSKLVLAVDGGRGPPEGKKRTLFLSGNRVSDRGGQNNEIDDIFKAVQKSTDLRTLRQRSAGRGKRDFFLRFAQGVFV